MTDKSMIVLAKTVLLGYSLEDSPDKFTVFIDSIDAGEDDLYIRFSVSYDGTFIGFTQYASETDAMMALLLQCVAIYAFVGEDLPETPDTPIVDAMLEQVNTEEFKADFGAGLMAAKIAAADAVSSGSPLLDIYSAYLVPVLNTVIQSFGEY